MPRVTIASLKKEIAELEGQIKVLQSEKEDLRAVIDRMRVNHRDELKLTREEFQQKIMYLQEEHEREMERMKISHEQQLARLNGHLKGASDTAERMMAIVVNAMTENHW